MPTCCKVEPFINRSSPTRLPFGTFPNRPPVAINSNSKEKKIEFISALHPRCIPTAILLASVAYASSAPALGNMHHPNQSWEIYIIRISLRKLASSRSVFAILKLTRILHVRLSKFNRLSVYLYLTQAIWRHSIAKPKSLQKLPWRLPELIDSSRNNQFAGRRLRTWTLKLKQSRMQTISWLPIWREGIAEDNYSIQGICVMSLIFKINMSFPEFMSQSEPVSKLRI